ncbi:MAG: ester cyclase [Candidatus Latescibacteria bacterium]|nr:ester cyclase [Candidatus Latescibacterota bacterium]
MTPAEANLRLWADHLKGEFVDHDANATMDTMVDDCYVMHMPTGIGGKGKDGLRAFYRDDFIPSIPPDWTHELLNRVVTDNYIVEEAMLKLTHTRRMNWLLPGVPPTGKRIEFRAVIFVEFRDGKIANERIYWDQADVLRQAGLPL